MLTTQSLGPRAFLKSLGFILDKKPHQIDRLLLKSLSPEDAAALQLVWSSRNAGYSHGLGQYLIPKTLKQAALQFSYDWSRVVATMEWFDQVVRKLGPNSIVEMGCGAGFLQSFLRSQHPAIDFQGVDAAKNLVAIGSELSGGTLVAEDYLLAEPDRTYDLVLCDCGFDMARFKPSTTPHSITTCADAQFCPGCSNDLKEQFDTYLRAWRRWGHAGGYLAVTGWLTNFGQLRAFVLAAVDAGWSLSLEDSDMLTVTRDGVGERLPALVFAPKSGVSSTPDMETIANFFNR